MTPRRLVIVLSIAAAMLTADAFTAPRQIQARSTTSTKLQAGGGLKDGFLGGPKEREEESVLDSSKFNKNSMGADWKQLFNQNEKLTSTTIEEPFRMESAQTASDSTDLTKVAVAGGVALAAAAASASGILPAPTEIMTASQNFFADPTASLQAVVQQVESMGPTGALYFGLVYTLAEVLAIPAFPLTASAGYLFGVVQGTGVVLASASIAASISFLIGRTVLRDFVEKLLNDYPEFKKMDSAIGREGFKLMLLLRLSPIFPFALSNYLYGATSVSFPAYFWGTMIGFTPGTIAYVYSGQVGKALTLGEGEEWYVYAGGFALLTAFLKVLADTATEIIESVQEEDALL